ncbi:MAG: ATP-binding cassette domain-containing protein, partial [Chloroflexi bacterium]|nr:ATP-binding cassette domain-containing protein [Chloroflexota bacterium]
PLLRVEGLKVHFPVTRGFIVRRTVGIVKAVDGISFDVYPGETLGLVGESGSGKTTTGRAIVMLTRPTAGRILFEGGDLTTLNSADLRAMRRRMGIVFQDPQGSLNPRMTAGNIVGEPLIVHGLYRDRNDYRSQVAELMHTVGLNPGMASRYPHEFSGGQRQRLGVARALAARPSLIVLDEPVSALDVSIQAQVINLLTDLQERLNLAYIFIAHDLSVVRHISDRVAVMYLGKIAELASSKELYANPQHPYTRALLSAVPTPDPVVEKGRERIVLKGDIPSPLRPPSGCVFHTRCPIAIEDCSKVVPELREVAPVHWAACIRASGYGAH